MPVLNWIGKDAVVRHDAEVPFRLLQDVPELGCGDADSGNLIVEGDNANQMEGVRNVERKPGSFSLPTASDRFYPDFLIRLDNGGLIAAEYKGSHIADGKDSNEKKRMGELWERRSNGRCAFAWVEVADSKSWTPLKRAVERCSGA